jgi:hypothetical protein
MNKKNIIRIITICLTLSIFGCDRVNTEQAKESKKVNQQQSQYAKSQPIPTYDWSFERDLMIQLYGLRNEKVATHSIWRSMTGMIEGDCPSLGYGLPYDVSLTNPLAPSRTWWGNGLGSSIDVVEQPEPNGVFASKNTSATWVMCINKSGTLDPIYVETKVTVYPYTLDVDYEKNRVKKAGESTITISVN